MLFFNWSAPHYHHQYPYNIQHTQNLSLLLISLPLSLKHSYMPISSLSSSIILFPAPCTHFSLKLSPASSVKWFSPLKNEIKKIYEIFIGYIVITIILFPMCSIPSLYSHYHHFFRIITCCELLTFFLFFFSFSSYHFFILLLPFLALLSGSPCPTLM